MRSNSSPVLCVPIDSVKPAPGNLRSHPPKQLAKLRKLLRIHGQVRPAVVTEDLELIDNELVWEALKKNGATHINVVAVHGLSQADKTALRLALNRTSQDARWDEAGLRNALKHLDEIKFDLELTGFDPPEIDSILRLDIPEANVEENGSDIPPLSEAVSQFGDVWALGHHRLGCGDGTDARFVNRVLQQQSASMAFTDPPQKLPVQGLITGKGNHHQREFVQGAGELSRDESFRFLHRCLTVIKASCAPNALIFACMDWRSTMEMTLAGHSCGMELLNICVWTRCNGDMGGLYRNQHEMVAVFKAGPDASQNNVELGRYGRNRTDVWSYPSFSIGKDRDERRGLHPTAKPVALIADAIRDVTKRGAIVLEPFLGSGSTLMAAQETGRLCFGIELDPQSVDVSIRRWQNATGRTAVLLDTGETFAEVTRRQLLPPPRRPHGK